MGVLCFIPGNSLTKLIVQYEHFCSISENVYCKAVTLCRHDFKIIGVVDIMSFAEL